MDINKVVSAILEAQGLRVLYKYSDKEVKMEIQEKFTEELVKLKRDCPDITEEEAIELFSSTWSTVLYVMVNNATH